MKHPVRRLGALPACLAGLGLFALACRQSAGFAARWRDGVSLPAMSALHRLTARVPFPVLEPLAVVLAAAALAAVLFTPPRRWLRGLLWGAAILAGSLALLWTPACRVPVDLPPPVTDAGRLAALCDALADALNASGLRFPAASEILAAAPQAAGMPDCAVKAARYPEWLRARKLAGLFAPPTGEVIVDATSPAPLIPFTAVHELMHLSGIADEGAANIAAWQSCLSAGGAFADSARLWALRYAMGRLAEADAASHRSVDRRMNGRLRTVYAACGGDIPPTAANDYAALADYLADPRRD